MASLVFLVTAQGDTYNIWQSAWASLAGKLYLHHRVYPSTVKNKSFIDI